MPTGRRDVAAVLHRIAFLLERQQASAYRCAAYRRAGDAVRALTEDAWAARVRDGRWQELRGVGPSTEQVITAVLAGGTPAVLAEAEDGLERRLAGATDAGRELRAALRGDLHAHTEASDGSSPLGDMALAAAAVGHEYLAITDHSPRLTVANGLSPERLAAQIAAIDRANADGSPVRLLRGIEIDVLEDGTLDQVPEMLDRLDVVVASVHSKLRMERAAMTRRMLTAVAQPWTDVLGHCTGRRVVGRPRPPSEFDAAAVFAACAEHQVAVEVNSRPDRQDPPDGLLALAAEAGCLFSVDSDAHAPGQLDWLVDGCDRLAAHDVPAERVVNTWPADRLLAWTSRRADRRTG